MELSDDADRDPVCQSAFIVRTFHEADPGEFPGRGDGQHDRQVPVSSGYADRGCER